MTPSASRDVDAGVAVSEPPERAPALPDRRTTIIRLAITGIGIAASVARRSGPSRPAGT